MPQLVSNQTIDNQNMVEGAITANGKYHAYVSPAINSANDNAMEATLQISAIVPDREGLGKARVTLICEKEDDAGNWSPFHALAQPFQAIDAGPNENGGVIPALKLSYGPGNPTANEVNGLITKEDGVNTILQTHPEKGTLGSSIRFCVVVHERDFGGVGAFQSMTFSLEYELFDQ